MEIVDRSVGNGTVTAVESEIEVTMSKICRKKKRTALRAIAALRARDGYSQGELGRLVNSSQQAVARWELGTAEPRHRNLFALADVFGCTVDVLLGREPIPPREKTLQEKLEQFQALEDGTDDLTDIDPLTRSVFERYAGYPEKLDKVARSIVALRDLHGTDGRQSFAETVEAVLSA